MDRNKVIYALSDAALVVSSAAENGGTWAGAMEALDAARIPLYVKAHGDIKEGNRKLVARGGRQFPEGPWADLRSLFAAVSQVPTLFNAAAAEPAGAATSEKSHTPHEVDVLPATPEVHPRNVFEVILPDLLLALAEPGTEKDIERLLGVVPAQARAWLKRACDEGHVQKLNRPVRYVAAKNVHPLFSGDVQRTEDSQNDSRS
jgi:predicted Rossmann fold nucleotide-binding protein DprA/Smf involved in DNA uptake